MNSAKSLLLQYFIVIFRVNRPGQVVPAQADSVMASWELHDLLLCAEHVQQSYLGILDRYQHGLQQIGCGLRRSVSLGYEGWMQAF